ncbi:MAG TPA: molybdopterin-dependent oxidoreductase [Acidimicrobiia bacterium]
MNPPSRSRAALAGIAAVAMAFGASELLAALLAAPSLVQGIADRVVDSVPTAVKDLAISVFGTGDKPALLVGIGFVGLGLGAFLGVLSRRRPQPMVAAIALFGIGAAWATTISATAGPTVPWLLALAAIVAGISTFSWLMKPAPEPSENRRELLKATSLTGLGLILTGGGRLLAAAGRAAASGRASVDIDNPTAPDLAAGTSFDVEGLTPIVVPNEDFYRIDTAISIPRVAVDTWKLSLTGLVDSPYEVTFDELMEMDMVERFVTLSCVSNEVGGRLVGNARWLGVPLSRIVDRARPRPEASQLVGRAVDRFTVGFPLAAIYDGREALVAVAMNGEALPLEHGFPVRLVVSGLYGYVSATKWLSEIELTTWESFDAYWVPRGWSKEGPIKTQSRIDVPRNNIAVGPATIAGVAWAPNVGIEAVEVQVDNGSWTVAELSEPLTEDAWIQWQLQHDFGRGSHRIRVRATDQTGFTQTENPVPPAPDGAEGWHTVSVTAR